MQRACAAQLQITRQTSPQFMDGAPPARGARGVRHRPRGLGAAVDVGAVALLQVPCEEAVAEVVL